MNAFHRASLSKQFLLASFPILLLGMIIIGAWVGKEVERGVTNRISGVAGLYVESFLSPYVQNLERGGILSSADHEGLRALLKETSLGKRVVSFKLWRPNGEVLYSIDPSIIGRVYPIGEGLADAVHGSVHAEISELKHEENEVEAWRWTRLVETYVPIRAEGKGTVVAVAEFYQTTDELDSAVMQAKRESWLVVASTVMVMYLLLFGLVNRGSKTIVRQRQELEDKVAELTELNKTNQALTDRVQRAAGRTTALNEQFLRQISADLHDGPGQDMSLALMRVEEMADAFHVSEGGAVPLQLRRGVIETVRSSLESALTDLRAISSGLRLPDIESFTVNEVAERAVRDYERKTGVVATLHTSADMRAALPVRITMYRLIQEALGNGYRHGRAPEQIVSVICAQGTLYLLVADGGAGFDPQVEKICGRHGLAGMRERVEILGGSFDIKSAPEKGTVVHAQMPLYVGEGIDD